MKLPYEIRIIEDINELATTVNKSNFIAQVYPFFSENSLKEHLTIAKKKYYSASHHCYAYKFADGTFRYSDAGEPTGTAGIRIMNAIEHFNLSNQLIIVSRIYGGVKLGVGPLGKAYYDSAIKLIEGSKIILRQLYQRATLSAAFEEISKIHRILSLHNSIAEESDYSNSVELKCLLKSSEIEQISKKISDFGKDKIKITIHDETVYK